MADMKKDKEGFVSFFHAIEDEVASILKKKH